MPFDNYFAENMVSTTLPPNKANNDLFFRIFGTENIKLKYKKEYAK